MCESDREDPSDTRITREHGDSAPARIPRNTLAGPIPDVIDHDGQIIDHQTDHVKSYNQIHQIIDHHTDHVKSYNQTRQIIDHQTDHVKSYNQIRQIIDHQTDRVKSYNHIRQAIDHLNNHVQQPGWRLPCAKGSMP